MSQTGSEDRFVNPTVGKKYWVKHAYVTLVETASRYNAVITYGDLAEEVQRRSGLHTTAPLRNWVVDLLKMIAQANQLRDEPALTSLVVHKHDLRVGAGYDEARRLAGQPPIADEMERENQAAAARLECYRRWCDDVPEDARSVLSAFRSHPHIEAAALYDNQGRVFATFPARLAPAQLPASLPPAGFHFNGWTLTGTTRVA